MLQKTIDYKWEWTLTELTPKFKEINSILENIHNKRMLRLKQKTYSTMLTI